MAAAAPMLSREAAREAALKVQAVMTEPNNSTRLEAAQREAAGDISKFFMICIPLVTEILGDVIKQYNFEPTQQGALSFSAELQKHKEDPEISRIANDLKLKFMPASLPANLNLAAMMAQPKDEMAD